MEVPEEKIAKLVAPCNTSAVGERVPTAVAVSLLAPPAIMPSAAIPAAAAPMPIPAIVVPITVPMMRVSVKRIVGIGIARVPIGRIRVGCPRIAIAVIKGEVLRASRVLHRPQAKRGGGEDGAREYCAPAPAWRRIS